MSELISGKEAKLAWANGEELEVAHVTSREWENLTNNYMLSVFDNVGYIFRIKPRTITINGIEVPAPFELELELKHDDEVWYLTELDYDGYSKTKHRSGFRYFLGKTWRTEDEIKQVVEALRSIFK